MASFSLTETECLIAEGEYVEKISDDDDYFCKHERVLKEFQKMRDLLHERSVYTSCSSKWAPIWY